MDQLFDEQKSLDTLIKSVIKTVECNERHKKRCLRKLLAWRSEIGGKYSTPYRSESVCKLISKVPLKSKSKLPTNETKIELEHVIPIKKIIESLLSEEIELTSFLNNNLVTCLVTKEEHEKLTKLGFEIIGWERYKELEINIFDINKSKFLF